MFDKLRINHYLMILHKFLFVVLSFPALLFCLNINQTFATKEAYSVASLLVGTPSSNFPGVSFLNYILFGHADLPYTFDNYLLTYGQKSSILEPGDLVIGNDKMLAGIVDIDTFIVIPIPLESISSVHRSSLVNIFLKGYTILKNDVDFDKTPYYGKSNGYIGSTKICASCLVDLMEHMGTTIADVNNVIYFYMWDNCNVGSVFLYGYVQNYNTGTMTGIIMITFYESKDEENEIDNFGYTDKSHDNSLNFSLDSSSRFVFNANIYLLFGTIRDNFNFSGALSHI